MLVIARILGLSALAWLLAATLIFTLRRLMIARILAVSLLTAAGVMALLITLAKWDQHPGSDALAAFLGFVGAVVGAVVGAIAGAAREIVAAQRRKPPVWVDVE